MDGEGSKLKVNIDDVYVYFRIVKDKFYNDYDKYDKFFVIMNNFEVWRYVYL